MTALTVRVLWHLLCHHWTYRPAVGHLVCQHRTIGGGHCH